MNTKPLAVHDKVQFTGPLGVINTGIILKIEDGLAVVAVDVPLTTFPTHDLTLVAPAVPEPLPTIQTQEAAPVLDIASEVKPATPE
jgi:molybdopterin-guanine dinucleotide biosynthesis protein A